MAWLSKTATILFQTSKKKERSALRMEQPYKYCEEEFFVDRQ